MSGDGGTGSAVGDGVAACKTSVDVDWRSSKVTVGEGLAHSLETGLYTDVSFKVGPTQQIFNAHKLILMVRSEVFATMFHSRWTPTQEEESSEEGRRIINIPDKHPLSFKYFLKYLYTDEFSNISDVNVVLEIMELAHYYQVAGLFTKCAEYLKEIVCVSSCIDIYQGTRLYSEIDLSAYAFEYLFNNFAEVAEDYNFFRLDATEFIALLERDDLKIDELRLFRALVRWGSATDPYGEVRLRANVMKWLAHSIRYLLISPEDFAREVLPTKVLSSDEALEILRYQLNGGRNISKRVKQWTKPRFKPRYDDELKCFPLPTECGYRSSRHSCPTYEQQLGRLLTSTSVKGQLTPQFWLESNAPVSIRGLKFYGFCCGNIYEPLIKYSVQFSITQLEDKSPFKDGKEINIFRATKLIPEFGNFDVMLEQPFQMVADQKYLIRACLDTDIGGDHTWDCTTGHGVRIHKEDISTKSKLGKVTFKISHEGLSTLQRDDCGGWSFLETLENSEEINGGISVSVGIVRSILFDLVKP